MLNVLSIGGNALDSPKSLAGLLKSIHYLSKKGKLLITHGNGPQVGELANLEKASLGILTAQIEAQMGILLEEQIIGYLERRGVSAKVETVLTKVLVDPADAAFKRPSKPIGRFYSEKQAHAMKNVKLKKLLHGYRRVVASPKPLKILNLGPIESLLSKSYIVIAAGGGGIPMYYKNSRPNFADAVIDKDFTTSLLAKSLNASCLYVLTNVDRAYLHYGKRGQRELLNVSTKELSKYLGQGEFEEGSMKPKIEGAIDFVKSKNKMAVIGNIKNALDVVRLKNCTVITA